MNLPQINFRHPKWGKIMLPFLVLAAITLVIWVAWSFNSKEKVDPEMLLNTSLQKTLASNSYRFNLECRLGDDNKPVSNITGERADKDKVHIKGKLINSPVEFVQYQDNTYMKDPFSGKWLTLQGNQLAQAESFVIEFNPLANFNFKDIPEINYVGPQEVEGQRLEVLDLAPNIEMPFLENQFDTFKYRIWINTADQRIYRALIKASHSGNSKALMQIKLKLWDFDQDIKIEPPV